MANSFEQGISHTEAGIHHETLQQNPGLLLVLIGPTAGGKTSVANELAGSYGFQKLVTTTTRDLREGEKAGVDYNLTSIDHFKFMIDNNQMAEWNKYGEHYYGLPKKDLVPLFSGRNTIWVGDTSLGAQFEEKLTASYGKETVQRLLPNTVIIYIGTPTLPTLRDRFLKRKNSNDDFGEKKDRDDFRRRVRRDWQDWITYKERFQHVVINENNGLQNTVAQVLTIIQNQQNLANQ